MENGHFIHILMDPDLKCKATIVCISNKVCVGVTHQEQLPRPKLHQTHAKTLSCACYAHVSVSSILTIVLCSFQKTLIVFPVTHEFLIKLVKFVFCVQMPRVNKVMEPHDKID